MLGIQLESIYLFSVVFDAEFSGGLSIRCNSNRSYRLPGSALINITYGRGRTNQSHQPNPKPVARIHSNQANSHTAEAAPVRIQARPIKPQAEAPKQAKKSEDGFCPLVAPPDPKMLPNPAGFFNKSPNVRCDARPVEPISQVIHFSQSQTNNMTKD